MQSSDQVWIYKALHNDSAYHISKLGYTSTTDNNLELFQGKLATLANLKEHKNGCNTVNFTDVPKLDVEVAELSWDWT